MRQILCGFLFLTSLIHAEDYEMDSYEVGAYQMASTEGDPSGLILGCTNALSGEYFYLENSVFVAGASPLHFQHFYSSSLSNNADNGFVYMPYLYMEYDIGAPEKGRPARVWISEKTGGQFIYEMEKGAAKKIKKGKKVETAEFRFAEDRSNEWGVTNTAHGTISARINPKNNIVIQNREDHSFEVHSSDGSTRLYKYTHEKVDGSRWRPHNISVYTRQAFLEFERLPNGHVIKYEWNSEVGQTRKLKKIRILADGSPHDFACIEIGHKTRDPGDNRSFYFVTSDGKEGNYKYERAFAKENKKHLFWRPVEIISPDMPKEKLEYHSDLSHKQGMIAKRRFPGGNYIHIDYYGKGSNQVLDHTFDIKYQDPRCHRIKKISLPLGDKDAPVDIMTFIHHPGTVGKTGGSTETFDAYHNYTVYHYSPELRLELIEKFMGKNTLWQKEKIVWDGINLANRSMVFPDDKALLSKSYLYDEKGNVKEERWVGNFSGEKADRHALKNGLPVEEEAETFSTFYTFTDLKYDNRTAANQIKTVETENGLKTTFLYEANTTQVKAKLISYNGKIRQRHLYFYDPLHLLIKEVVDNGSSEDVLDLTGVSERKTISYANKKEDSYFGMPDTMSEAYYDSASCQDVPLKKHTLFYTTGGKVATEAVLDAEDTQRFLLHRQYDSQGRMVKESDPLGRFAQYAYDENNNKTFSRGFGERKECFLKYDSINRLKSLEEKGDDGVCHVSSYTYDFYNHKTSETDFLGNQTFFLYDSLGNLKEKRLPSVLDENGVPYEVCEFYEVDAAGRVITTTSSLSDTSHIRYNAYNKPIQIIHPDGTTERFVYYKDGNLKEFIDQEGVKTSYTYDPLGRETSKTLIGKDGTVLFEEHQTYDSFHLLEKKDSTGMCISYEYDGAGRPISEDVSSEGKHCKKIFAYDTLGNLFTTVEVGDSNSCYTIKTYDLLNRVVQERLEDDQGTILSRSAFKYDLAGNLSETTKEVQGMPSHECFFYDSFHRLIRYVDAEGKPTHYEYNENFTNSLGQRVLQKTTVDPILNRTVETCDALGRCVSILIKNASGQTLSWEEFSYDRRGNKARQVSHVMAENEELNILTTSWEYNSMGKLISLTEAAGTPEEKITQYQYSDKGLMTAILKPDGVKILFGFDELGRNIEIKSSEGTVHYTLTYNAASQLIHSYDHTTHLFFERGYDGFGNLLFEKLSNGLQLESHYDNRGRRDRLTLPDRSFIHYGYGSLFPTTVERYNTQGTKLYLHEYNQFDLSGNLIEQTLPKNLGKCFFETDVMGRSKKVKNPYETYEITEFDNAGLAKTMKNLTLRGSDRRNFAYDDLGQLIKEQGRQNASFAYDSHNNRLNKDSADYAINALSELSSTDVAVYKYDLNGNMVEKTTSDETIRFAYDALGRLTKASFSDGKVVSYTYDSFHRRIAKKVSHSDQASTTFYLYDDQYEIGEYNEKLNPKNLRILGDTVHAEIGAAIAIESEGKVLIPLHDLFGNVVALIDSDSKQAVESYEYSSFGETKIYNAQGMLQQTSANPWRYMSKYADDDLNLIFFGRRYYDPEIGRWTTPDPAGFIDGLNLYAFVMNNPLMFVDLFGLATQSGTDGLPQVKYENFEQRLIDFANMFPYVSPATKAHIEETHRSRAFQLGEESIRDLRFGFMNGVNTNEMETKSMGMDIIKFLDGYGMDVVYNATHGFATDVYEAAKGLLHTATEPVKVTQQTWDKFFNQCSSKGVYVMIGTSQAAIHINNALLGYPTALRERIILYLLAPAAYAREEICKRVTHYRAEWFRDPIPHIDIPGRLRSKNTTVVLKSHPDDPWFNHSLMNKTYLKPLEVELKRIIANFESKEATR